MNNSYTPNKGTLLVDGKYNWKVRVDNMASSNDIGVALPTCQTHFNLSPVTAWGIRDNGYAHPPAQPAQPSGVHHGHPFKTGDVLSFDLDLHAGTLDCSVNGVFAYKHTGIPKGVHICMSGSSGAQATLID